MLNIKERMQSDSGVNLSVETILLLLVTAIVLFFVARTVIKQVLTTNENVDKNLDGLNKELEKLNPVK